MDDYWRRKALMQDAHHSQVRHNAKDEEVSDPHGAFSQSLENGDIGTHKQGSSRV